MEDKSFLNLTTDELLQKIDIDPRLILSFKRVMEKMQNYFNANGYTSQRNYEEFLNEYLITENKNKKMRIQSNDEPSKVKADGFYNKFNRVICIDESILTKDYLDSVLCHEFIHFLVMHDTQIKSGNFVNEALTEMLTQQIYPNSRAYVPQVDMMRFANLLSGNVNNYQKFLKGGVDSAGGPYAWRDFLQKAEAYHAEVSAKDLSFNMNDAIKNENYIAAQRQIITEHLNYLKVADLDTYLEKIRFLIDRPVKDYEFINEFVNRMDSSFILSLGISDSSLQELFKSNLAKLREIELKLHTYKNQSIHEFEFMGRTIAIDKDMKYYCADPLFGMSISSSPSDGIMTFMSSKDPNTVLKLNINEIDFEKRKKELLTEKEKLSGYFSPSSKKDIQTVNELAQTREGLVKLEKYTLPRIGFDKRKPQSIYIAHYKDKIEVLGSLKQLGTASNINIARYIGVTAKENGLISCEQLGTINNGYKFSVMTEKQINGRIVSLIDQRLRLSDDDKIKELITFYQKNSVSQKESDDESLKDSAIWYYANHEYASLTPEQKTQFEETIVKQGEQFMISSTNGNIEVSLLFGDKTMFKGKCETLIDIKGNGLYNEEFENLSKNHNTPINISGNVIISKDANGNIMMPQKKEKMETSQSMVNIEKETGQNNTIGLVERALGIRITPTKGYLASDNVNTPPKAISKSQDELLQEQIYIFNNIKQLLESGQIDQNKADEMKNTLNIEYQKMISRAPKETYYFGPANTNNQVVDNNLFPNPFFMEQQRIAAANQFYNPQNLVGSVENDEQIEDRGISM